MKSELVAAVAERFPEARMFREQYRLPIPSASSVLPDPTPWLDTRVDGVRVRGFPTVMKSRHTIERLFTGAEFMTLFPDLVHPVPIDPKKGRSILEKDSRPYSVYHATLSAPDVVRRSVAEIYLQPIVQEIAKKVGDLGCEIKIASAEQLLTIFITLVKERRSALKDITVRARNFSGAQFYLDLSFGSYEGEPLIFFDENPGGSIFELQSYIIPVLVAKE